MPLNVDQEKTEGVENRVKRTVHADERSTN